MPNIPIKAVSPAGMFVVSHIHFLCISLINFWLLIARVELEFQNPEYR